MSGRQATVHAGRQSLLLALGVGAGLLLAYIDSLPHWDDAGIVAAGLFGVTGLLALLGHSRPWLLALAVGLWLPLRGVLVSHDATLLVVLVFPFLGAYAGFLVAKAHARTRNPM